MHESDPPTQRDTVPIRPLGHRASRLFLTVALASAVGLGVFASLMIRTMSHDPALRERIEVLERMAAVGDTTAAAGDSTVVGVPPPNPGPPESGGQPRR